MEKWKNCGKMEKLWKNGKIMEKCKNGKQLLNNIQLLNFY